MYTRYAAQEDSAFDSRLVYHDVFCTDEEMTGFMRLRYPKEAKDPAAVREILALWKNETYRNPKNGTLLPNINMPEPYRTRLYSGEFDEPWSPIYF